MEQNPFKNSNSFFNGLIPLRWYTLQEELQCENCHIFFLVLFYWSIYSWFAKLYQSTVQQSDSYAYIHSFLYSFPLSQDTDYSSQLFISCVNKLEAKCQLSHVKISQRQISSKLSFRFMIDYLWGRHPEDDGTKKNRSHSYR